MLIGCSSHTTNQVTTWKTLTNTSHYWTIPDSIHQHTRIFCS